MKSQWIITILIALVVGAGAFFGGIKYNQSQSVANANISTTGGRGASARGQGRFGQRATVGEIVSEDANSITIKLPDGSSKIINISNTTAISKMDSGSKTDLVNGIRVAAMGTSNSDGSVNAQFIQINPMFGRGGQNATPSAVGQ